ncbi:MAG: membrane protein [Cyclobacteriaceae bacterium]|nr:MAG: membrane protein [Cyclobacteriaceae bacterium]
MASGIFAVLDDVATLLDDVAGMSKIATKKTAGILGDDLAVNAEKASGFVSSRELPVLWAISKGSLLNKLIILPFAFLLSAFLPWAVTVVLVLGGLYLAFEGAEKIYEFFVPHDRNHIPPDMKAPTKSEILTLEKSKIKSAIVTDFILSVEIVIIALGTVLNEPLVSQIVVVSIVALIATVGVYGIVALIIRMDEFGARLMAINEQEHSISDKIGRFFVNALPKVIKALSVIGTIALILVAGGIFVHSLPFLHHIFPKIPGLIIEFMVGLLVGFLTLLIFKGAKKLFVNTKLEAHL